MIEQSPLNFDLLIERFEDNYRARVVASPAGETSGIFEATLDSLKLENFILEASKESQDSLRMGPIKKFGANLFNTVFTKDVFTCYMRSLDIARKDERGLRIRLRIDVPEFHNLPWEYLYNTQIKQFIALSNDTPIVRYFDLPFPASTFAIKPPLKILVMLSSPKEYPALDLDQEWTKLNKALAPLINKNLVRLERLEKPTLSQLQQSLRREDVHIFHYIGHGKFLERNQDGKLLLEDDYGKGLPVSGDQLGTILHDHESLRLVVLSACEGARTSSEDPFAGVAQTLVQQGIPAIIAMQVEILENAAIHFAEEFYKSIVDGFSIDAAVSEGRKAIFSKGNETEWGTPVLFTRAPDSGLLSQARSTPVASTSTEVAKPTTVIPKAWHEDLRIRYGGLVLIVLLIAWFGISNMVKARNIDRANATATAVSNISATSVQSNALTATEQASIMIANETTSTAYVRETLAAQATEEAAPTATATKAEPTPTVTPITPPLSCLDDRWTVKLITNDTPPSTEPIIENGCATYKGLGISASSAGLSFLQNSFRIPGSFGIITPLPIDPKEVSLTIKFLDISGGGQGEFWVALSNGTDPVLDSMSITIQPKGPVKYYINGAPTEPTVPINAVPIPYTYSIKLTINGNYVNSVVNSTYYRNNLAVSSGPKYLFLGYTKRSNQGTVNVQVDVVDLEFK